MRLPGRKVLAYRFVFLNPGHFHAALALREKSDRVDPKVVVYAPDGNELDAFVALVESFNSRTVRPTSWQIEHRKGDVNDLISDGCADVAVLAGANNVKLSATAAIAKSGIHVFADKPWLTDSGQLVDLNQALNASGSVMDIMTIRHEILSRLCHEVVHTPEVFGQFQRSSVQDPAIELGSVHHLYKKVNGQPLRRPHWYYDVGVQGDGLADIQSHLIEQAMWFVRDDSGVKSGDATLHGARRWTTPVDAALYEDSTGSVNFPEQLVDAIDADGVLQLACNGEINWSLNDVHITQRAQWRQREPEDAGDLHQVVLRGTQAVVHVEQGQHTRFKAQVHVEPAHPNTRKDLLVNAGSALQRWQSRFPGLALLETADGFRFDAPDELDRGHESHFPLVRDSFLDILDDDASIDNISSRIRERYTLIASAIELERDLANKESS